MRSFILSLALGVAALVGTLVTPSSASAQPRRLYQPVYYPNTYPAYSYYYDPGTVTYSPPVAPVSYYYDPGVVTYTPPATTGYYYSPNTAYYYTPGYYYAPSLYYRRWR